MKTNFLSKEDAEKSRKWMVVDATGVSIGRLASQVASILRGKHKPTFTPHVDAGDFVVVLNAANVQLTGNKKEDKTYYSYSGYIGGLKEVSAGKMLEKQPEKAVIRAVKGMLPRGPLGRKMLLKLKVYSGSEHPHSAQQPERLELKN